MFIKEITSRTNPLIVQTASLLSTKGRKKHNNFLFEGIKLFNEAVDSNVEIEYIFITEENVCVIDEKLPNTNVKVYIIPKNCFEKISSEKAPQGIICVAKLPKLQSIDKCDTNIPTLILSDIQDAGNLGTIIRTAKALFQSNIILTGACADVYGHKCIRASMGAVFKQNVYVEPDFERIVNYFHSKGKNVCAAALKSNSKSILDFDISESAVVLGNEGHGLSDKQISLCDPIIIPMSGMESLNVSSAASIVLWEMARGILK